ncbi:WD40-repeat-containing domain protein [Bombardia bombarda]|uniref:WD40-repeat-containing domain protein n=1 Tax=Bombardia bombarda TaxID=252184 RepID=A0AA39X9H1_9PEZI|nr:WD40-repeat-containing domain protein [Bombardia bombarda]
MSPSNGEPGEWDIPKLRYSAVLQDDWELPPGEQPSFEIFDVKFYPYNPPGTAPLFAAASKKHVVIARLNENPDQSKNPCEILKIIRDDDESACNCCCCWTKCPETERPWLCVAGADAKVKIYDVVEGKLVKTLVGHGGGINDLATSPGNPYIIASASEDTTVRIWSLATVHVEQSCVCLLGGEGHSWDLLSVAFHSTGQHVISAGHDQVINLWTLPELPTGHVDIPIVIHYPQFSTSEVHNNLVDCVAFFGDLILSRACHEDIIVLWRVEGFCSDDPPLLPSQAPTTYDPSKKTRSAFCPTLSEAQPAYFTRLLQFHTPDCMSQFYLRFNVYHVPNKHPILAFCNAKSKILFWDIARFGAYERYMADVKAFQAGKRMTPPEKPSFLQVKKGKKPESSAVVSASPDPQSIPNATAVSYNQVTLSEWAEMYDTTNSHGMIKPHRTVAVADYPVSFVGRQVAWSTEGEWCLVVGNNNMILICQRWGRDTKGSTPFGRKGSTPAPTPSSGA